MKKYILFSILYFKYKGKLTPEEKERKRQQEKQYILTRLNNVSAVINIPGMGKAIIINHGEYYTVYSKLKEVTVSQGQSVTLKQTIGSIGEDDDGATEIHLEIWYNQDKQNPETWLAK